jgi:hypothetical protein
LRVETQTDAEKNFRKLVNALEILIMEREA